MLKLLTIHWAHKEELALMHLILNYNCMSAFAAVFADTRYSLNMPSSSENAWGNLATPTGQITWRKSYFKTTYVNVVYMMLNQR